jgi:NAD(P)-dependent dehydrogenase (short-subunit alcohol dehydrogenase family)
MSEFQEKVVLVTGANGNLGLAVAQAFAEQGAQLALITRAADVTLASLSISNPDKHLLVTGVDVTNAESVADMQQQVLARYGQVDVLVNTVGGFSAGNAVHDTELKTWDVMMTLNARAAFVLSREIIATMLGQNSGRIIHIAAGAGLKAGKGNAAYSAAKSAVIRLTEGLAADYKDSGINANCVLPGIIDTPQNRKAMPEADTRRWVQPESIAEVIMFLASSAARDIHGAALPVTGRS